MLTETSALLSLSQVICTGWGRNGFAVVSMENNTIINKL